MFNWLRRKMLDRYRRIFKYYDGEKTIWADPLILWRGIMTHPEFNPETHGPAFDRGETEAYNVVLGCVRDVFKVKTFSGFGEPGLTEQETISLFKRFLAYCEDLKKSIETSQTSSEPTTSIPSPDYTLPPELQQLTKGPSDSPSTSNVKDTEPLGCC